jgi:hypothetical protein
MPPHHLMLKPSLEQRIYNTIQYWSLFDRPVTSMHIWRALLGPGQVSLAAVQQTLATSDFLKEKIGTKWGYYFLKGQEASVARRLDRFLTAQKKWRLLKRIARLLIWVPGVSMLAGSGSLAVYNTSAQSDLDVFVVTKPKRIWLTRLLLLVVTQLTGRRRTYRDWRKAAPDLVCLNHYVTEESLVIAPEIRNVYTAMLYTHLVPLAGSDMLQRFQHANSFWLQHFVATPPVPMLYEVPAALPARWLNEPLWDLVDRWAKRLQTSLIAQHHAVSAVGRVVATDGELAFHPGTKADTILSHLGT